MLMAAVSSDTINLEHKHKNGNIRSKHRIHTVLLISIEAYSFA